MEFYEQGTTANGMDDNNADMLLVLEERSISWSVNSDYCRSGTVSDCG